ncbi:hypothetical protein KBZ07_10050 [Cyanobium sp. BA20m-14]|nr:hypothetical protein [Cyanobium sp. BA20m-14]
MGAAELLDAMWAATIAGLNPEGVTSRGYDVTSGVEFCLAQDVESAKAEIERRLRARFADGLVQQIAMQIPRLSKAELAAIRDLHADAIAADQ